MEVKSVWYLQSISFSELSLEEKNKIKTVGRPTPDLDIKQSSTSRQKTYVRNFNRSLYDIHKWLCGCEKRNSLFCFPCLLFGGDPAWTKVGVANLQHLISKLKKHGDSAIHLKNVMNLAILGSVNVTVQMNEEHRRETNMHNEEVRKNREILTKMIDCIKFCGKFKLPLHVEDEYSNSCKPGIFLGVLDFARKLDDSLKNHLSTSTVFEGTSKTVVNDLLDCILEVSRDEIVSQIKQAKYVAIMTDDTTDISQNAQQVIVFRYELKGDVFERFWGFFNPTSQNAKDVSECIKEQLKTVLKGDDEKLIAQTYDGPVRAGMQAKEVFPTAHFIYCYAHRLNRIIEKAVSQNVLARIFFSGLQGITEFFYKSPSRLEALDKVSLRIRPDRRMGCNFNGRPVNSVFENKDALKEYFTELQQDNANTNNTIQLASGLLRMLNDNDFNFWLTFFYCVTLHVDILRAQLQTRDASSAYIHKALQQFLESINKIKNALLCDSEHTLSFQKRKIEDNDEKFISAKEVCDIISFQTKERFSFTKHLSAANLFSESYFCGDWKENKFLLELHETFQAYPFINKERLKTELLILYETDEFKNIGGGVLKMHKMFIDSCIGDAFVEVFNLMKIVLTTPMITSELGRCFSTLERIKTFLRSTRTEQRLSALAMLSCEKLLIENIQSFNEKVIDKFAARKEMGMSFLYK